jgi:hydrogenase maturation protein HypF
MTSSLGRLFDAAAVLAGLRPEATYEAQAAMELEGFCRARPRKPYRFDLRREGALWLADPAPALEAMLCDAGRPQEVSESFHGGVCDMACRMVKELSRETGIKTVALSGGVFQNRLILEWLKADLEAHGFEALCNRQVPANDGGIALGQAWAAMSA